jgi:hypothetical protein
MSNPPLFNLNSFVFVTSTDQLPGYYTPTAGWTGTLYQAKTAYPYVPGMGLGTGMGTPLLLSGLEDKANIGWMADTGFFPPQFNPFEPHQPLAPDGLSHQLSDFQSMAASGDRSPMEDSRITTEMQSISPITNFSPRPDDTSASASLSASLEK